MIQEKHWEYNAMATESRESIAFGEKGGRNIITEILYV